MTNRIGDANRKYYLDILKGQTGFNLTIGSDASGYYLRKDGQDISRHMNGTAMYEAIFAMTRLMHEVRQAGMLKNPEEVEA